MKCPKHKMKKITFCIPSKNNLRYLKSCITSIRENSAIEHDIIVYVDADNDGTINWLKEHNVSFLVNESSTPKGIAYAYNRCIEAAQTEIVCMFHADMYMARGFDIGIIKHLSPGKVVAGTRIEPPLHPEGKEKIVKNFGMYPEDFMKKEFDSYVETLLKKNVNVTTRGMFAPWAIYKNDIVVIGMHDESFHSYHEDSDIFNRFILMGYELLQSWEAYAYHLTCRGGQFQDGIETVTSDPLFHKMKNESYLKYIKKWKSRIMNDEFHHPIVYPIYDITACILNSTESSIRHIESFVKPFVSRIILDDDSKVKTYDVLLSLDANKLTKEDFDVIFNIHSMLGELNQEEVGLFETVNLSIRINKLQNINKQNIYA